MTTATQKIPSGYKQTEVGVIPKDWVLDSLGQAISKVIDNRGKTPPLAPQGYQLLEVNSIYSEGKYPDFTKVSKYVDEDIYKNWFRDGHPIKGDIVIATVGTVGASAIIGDKSGCIAQNIVGLRISKNYDCQFVYYYTQSERYKSQVRAVLMGAVQPSLKVPHLLKILFAHPLTKTEQSTIASVLSDIDDLIFSLENLIAKKRAIKQGVMQELLTGKRRLPGFSEKWEYKELEKLCHSINDGTHRTPKYVDEGIPFYSVENVIANNFKDTKFITQEEHYELIKRCKPERGDILLTRIGDIGAVRLIDWDVNASIYVSLALLKVNDEIYRQYLYWYMKSFNFINALKKAALMNAIPPKINMEDIGKVTVFFPSDKKEQAAIAKVLSDIDAEIEELEQKLTKYKMLKQGIMQVLLTGKVRLV